MNSENTERTPKVKRSTNCDFCGKPIVLGMMWAKFTFDTGSFVAHVRPQRFKAQRGRTEAVIRCDAQLIERGGGTFNRQDLDTALTLNSERAVTGPPALSA